MSQSRGTSTRLADEEVEEIMFGRSRAMSLSGKGSKKRVPTPAPWVSGIGKSSDEKVSVVSSKRSRSLSRVIRSSLSN